MRLLSVVAIVLFAFGCRTTKSHSPQSAVNSKSPAVESPSNPDVVEKKSDVTPLNLVSVKGYGAVGDGVTDDTPALQAALDQNLSVFFPTPPVAYLVSSLQLRTNHTLVGDGKWVATIKGKGTGPIFKTGSYPALTTSIRQITIRDMSVTNAGFPILQLFNSPDFTIEHVEFRSSSTNTVEAHQSYRGVINDTAMSQSGTGWVIAFLDNMNATTISNNTVSGGSAGNAIDIGQSQSVIISGNHIEVGAGYGIRVGGAAANGGLCSAITINGNYFEEVAKPISLGEQFLVQGATVTSNYVGNSPTTIITERNYFLLAGRLIDSTISGNSYNGAGVEPFIKFAYINAPGSISQMQNSKIFSNHQTGVGANLVFDKSFPNVATIATLTGTNELQFASNPVTGVSREYVSGPIVAKTGAPSAAFAAPSPYGGVIDKIEVIDKVGDVTSKINVGTDVSGIEVASFNPQTLVYSAGTARAALAAGSILRPTANGVYSVTAGTGTGTFRVKITYRN